MRSEVGRGKWLAAFAAVFLSVVGCTLPVPGGKGNSGNNTNISVPSPTPTPSPSPTPTTEFGASAPAFHIGEVGVGYSPVGLTASGGVQPYHYNLSGGSLPPGLNLGTDGSVAGKPTAAGTFSFSIDVTDSGDGKVTVAGSITIASALNVSLLPACAKYCIVELGCANACGNFGQLSGGVGPFTYAQTQGQLPAGTSLNALSLTGTFTGLTGYLQFTVQVTDSLGATGTVSPTFWMYPHISLASGGCSTYYGTDCKAQLKISGGIPNDHFTVRLLQNNPPAPTQGCGFYQAPPPGSYGVGGSNVVIDIPGFWPGTASGYGAIWILQVTDSALCGPSTYCTSNPATAVVEVQCG